MELQKDKRINTNIDCSLASHDLNVTQGAQSQVSTEIASRFISVCKIVNLPPKCTGFDCYHAATNKSERKVKRLWDRSIIKKQLFRLRESQWLRHSVISPEISNHHLLQFPKFEILTTNPGKTRIVVIESVFSSLST